MGTLCPRTRDEPGICTERTAFDFGPSPFEFNSSPFVVSLSNHEHPQPNLADAARLRLLAAGAVAQGTACPAHPAPHRSAHRCSCQDTYREWQRRAARVPAWNRYQCRQLLASKESFLCAQPSARSRRRLNLQPVARSRDVASSRTNVRSSDSRELGHARRLGQAEWSPRRHLVTPRSELMQLLPCLLWWTWLVAQEWVVDGIL